MSNFTPKDGTTFTDTEGSSFDRDAGLGGVENPRLKRLGSGAQAEVWLVRYLGSEEAHKELRPGVDSARVFQEAINSRKAKHPNIVDVHGVLQEGARSALRMEYIQGGNYAELIAKDGALSVANVIRVGLLLTDALRATHEIGVVHQDLKPQNILYRESDQEPVVTDFGVSAALHLEAGKAVGGRSGTPRYMAPEVILDGQKSTAQSDVWSLAVTLLFFLSGSHPLDFHEENDSDAYEHLLDPFWTYSHIPSALLEVLQRAVARNVFDRWESMEQFHKQLKQVQEHLPCARCKEPLLKAGSAARCPKCDLDTRDLLSGSDVEEQLLVALGVGDDDEVQKQWNRLSEFPSAIGCVYGRNRQPPLSELVTAIPNRVRQQIASIDAALTEERYLDAFQLIEASLKSDPLHHRILHLRDRWRSILVELYKGVDRDTNSWIKERRFAALEQRLDRVDRVLSDNGARNQVRIALGERTKKIVHQLERVEKMRLKFEGLVMRRTEALQQQDFKSARAITIDIEKDFPSPDTKHEVANLHAAENLVAKANSISDEILAQLATAPTTLNVKTDGQTAGLKLQASFDACQKILSILTLDKYPELEPLSARCELLGTICDQLRNSGNGQLQDARGHFESGDLEAESSVLQSIRPLIVETDLFEHSDRQWLSSRIDQVRGGGEERRQQYQTGLAALEKKQYAKAQIEFEGALTALAIEDETAIKITEGLEKATELRSLTEKTREETTRALSELQRIGNDSNTTIPGDEYLKLTKSWRNLLDLVEEEEMPRHQKAMADLLVLYLKEVEKEFCSMSFDKEETASISAAIQAEFGKPCQGLTTQEWKRLLGVRPELRRQLCSTFEKSMLLYFTEDSPDILVLEAWTDALQSAELSSPLKELEAPVGEKHPWSVLLAGVAQWVDQLPADQSYHGFDRAFALYQRLPRLSHEATQNEITQQAQEWQLAKTKRISAEANKKRMKVAMRLFFVFVIVVVTSVATVMVSERLTDNNSFPNSYDELAKNPALLEEVKKHPEWIAVVDQFFVNKQQPGANANTNEDTSPTSFDWSNLLLIVDIDKMLREKFSGFAGWDKDQINSYLRSAVVKNPFGMPTIEQTVRDPNNWSSKTCLDAAQQFCQAVRNLETYLIQIEGGQEWQEWQESKNGTIAIALDRNLSEIHKSWNELNVADKRTFSFYTENQKDPRDKVRKLMQSILNHLDQDGGPSE
jgi:hypothetical protein